jgi:ATP-binding cassette subfamily B protein
MRKATNKLVEGVVAKMSGVAGAAVDFDYIGGVMLTLIGLYLSGSVLMSLQGLVLSSVSAKIGYRLRRELAE